MTSDIGAQEEFKISRLLEDPILLDSFQELVINEKVLTEEEFWKSK